MKNAIYFLVFLAASGPAWSAGNQKNCEELKRDLNSFCSSQQQHCSNLKSCLIRRDTCIKGGRPTSKEKCEAVNKCMADHTFDDIGDCEYKWTSEGSGKSCIRTPKLLSYKYLCPGRFIVFEGLFGILLLDGKLLDTASDRDYDCEAVANTFRNHRTICADYKTQYKKMNCPFPEELDKHQLFTCPESEQFTKKVTGKFAQSKGPAAAASKEVLDKNREEGKVGEGKENPTAVPEGKVKEQ